MQVQQMNQMPNQQMQPESQRQHRTRAARRHPRCEWVGKCVCCVQCV
jgi:hypothetical protein